MIPKSNSDRHTSYFPYLTCPFSEDGILVSANIGTKILVIRPAERNPKVRGKGSNGDPRSIDSVNTLDFRGSTIWGVWGANARSDGVSIWMDDYPIWFASLKTKMSGLTVVGSLLCSDGFSPGSTVFLPGQKSTPKIIGWLTSTSFPFFHDFTAEFLRGLQKVSPWGPLGPPLLVALSVIGISVTSHIGATLIQTWNLRQFWKRLPVILNEIESHNPMKRHPTSFLLFLTTKTKRVISLLLIGRTNCTRNLGIKISDVFHGFSMTFCTWFFLTVTFYKLEKKSWKSVTFTCPKLIFL